MRISVYYDARLTAILSDGKDDTRLVIAYNGQEIALPAEPDHIRQLQAALDSGKTATPLGAARLLPRKSDGAPVRYFFDIYQDQTLRRAPELDVFEYTGEDYNVNCIGWRNEVNPAGFLGPKGLIPGVQGNFITDGTEGFDIDVPYQFTNLCTSRGSDTVSVLKDFIATACRLHNTAELPRADGYDSRGAEAEELLARYFDLVYPKPGN